MTADLDAALDLIRAHHPSSPWPRLIESGRVEFVGHALAIAATLAGRPIPERAPPPPGPIVGPPWPTPERRVILRTFLNDYSGFGRFGLWTGKSLEMAGVPVGYDVICKDEQFREVGEWQRSRIVEDATEAWRLQAHYLGYPIAAGKATLYFTMAEVTGVLPAHAAEFNKCKAVIVPCRFNAEGFRDSGVAVPIHVVNPGLAPEEGFGLVEGQGATRTGGTFRVLFAGMLQHGGMRKGVRDAIAGFLAAFPDPEAYPDAELVLKLWPTCLPHVGPIPSDRRIRVITDPFTTHELADLYRQCTVLLAPTKGEGWGLHTFEAMGCGVPPIICLASGTADFADASTAYPLEYDWREATGYYAGHGRWHVPRPDSIVRQLRRAYAGREECAEIGRRAAIRAAEFTWEKSGRRLKDILIEEGALRRPMPTELMERFRKVRECPYRDRAGCGCAGKANCRKFGDLVYMGDCADRMAGGLCG
jgi:hypothetical protein